MTWIESIDWCFNIFTPFILSILTTGGVIIASGLGSVSGVEDLSSSKAVAFSFSSNGFASESGVHLYENF